MVIHAGMRASPQARMTGRGKGGRKFRWAAVVDRSCGGNGDDNDRSCGWSGRRQLMRFAVDKITCGRWRLRLEHALCDILNLKANITWSMQQALNEEALDTWLGCIQLGMELDELEPQIQTLLYDWSFRHRIASIKFARHVEKFWQTMGVDSVQRPAGLNTSSSTARDRIDTVTHTAAITAWRQMLARAVRRGTGSIPSPTPQPSQLGGS